MSYIAMELDALNKAPSVGRAARVAEDAIIGGLTRMWAHCFREKTAHLTSIQVSGFFAVDADLIPALVAFGFLAHEGQALRVKGADRYLRISEGRSKGGKAASANLRRGTSKPVEKPDPMPGTSREQAGADSRLTPGLSPSTDYRLPTTEHLKAAAGRPPLTTAIGFWVEAQDRRERIPGMVREKPPAGLDAWFSDAMMHVNGDEQRLLKAYDAFLLDPFWRNDAQKRCHWGGWVSQWRDFASRGAAPVPVKPTNTRSPAPVADWTNTDAGEVIL